MGWRRFAVPLVFGVVIVVLGAVALVLRAMAASPPASAGGRYLGPGGVTSRHAYAIACPAPDPDGTTACRRLAAEVARRPWLTADQQKALWGEIVRVQQAILGVMPPRGRCVLATQPVTAVPPCHFVPDTTEPASPDEVEAALRAAGFGTATVRWAGTDDPAPAGALLFAVRAGVGCIIGYRKAGTGTEVVMGARPDGSCLA
jgi:hypothetical protein